MGDTSSTDIEVTTLTVQVSFTLNIDPAAWAGGDGDTMTTKEVAGEVKQWAENMVRRAAFDEGVISDDEYNRRDTD